MTKRAEQREKTRDRIIEAACQAFAEHGFKGASTRDIAARADANQGLITYHFKTKEALWKAAADHLFALLRDRLVKSLAGLDPGDPRDFARETIREYVRFAAGHPELFGLMIDTGKADDERMRWLTDRHLKPMYEQFVVRQAEANEATATELTPNAYYAVAGAGSLLFAVAPECRRLTGLDPNTREAVEQHADFVARLMVP